MKAKVLALVGASLLIPSAAGAVSVAILGNPAARACYEAADSNRLEPGALELCNRALEGDVMRYEDRMATLVNRGIVKFRMRDFDSANADFDTVLLSNPDQPDALINKGIVMLAAGGSVDDALQLLNRGLDGRPARPWVGYYGRAVAHELEGRDGDAYADYNKARELRPNWQLAQDALARFSRS
jgi:tetratricopeptide (TPR) repeat protein